MLSLLCIKKALSKNFIELWFFTSKLEISIILKFFLLLSIFKDSLSKLGANMTSKKFLIISEAIFL